MSADADWVDYDVAARHGLRTRQGIRQVEVLVGIARGFTYAQIGQHLHISEETALSHGKRLLRSMGARSQAEAVALAYDAGVLRTAAMRAERALWRERLGVAA